MINESGYENGECYLTISDDTEIYVDGEKADISMIEAGQTIIAMYTGGIEETYPGRIKEVKEIIAEYPSATEGNISTEGVADYPAAIMVNDTIYLVEDVPMSVEIDDSAIIGYTESFTDTFPENNGETNFNPELGMPYAQVAGKIAVLYKNEWYSGTPFSNVADEKTITCKAGFSEGVPFGTLISITEAKTDQDEIPFTEEQIAEAKQAALTYYKGTVFTVDRIDYFAGDLPYGSGDDCCNFIVAVSKDGVMQEPGRTISMQFNNGIWEVVNEGY